jgi:hypothetical protein
VRDVQQALEVERDHPIPLLDRGVDDRPEQHHAGVVDHDVQSAELFRGALDGRDRLLAIGDVGLEREAADLGGERIETVLATRDEGDRRSLLCQRARRRLADAAARARHEGDGAVQCLGHGAEVYPLAQRSAAPDAPAGLSAADCDTARSPPPP